MKNNKSLPEYAKKGNIDRTFHSHCSNCKTGRYFELNTDFPEHNTLRSAEFGVYIGTCLYCGTQIYDNYNWSKD